MLDSYKQSIDKNKIPPGLLESTAEKMHSAMELPAERKTFRRSWSYALAAVAAVLIFVFVFPFADQAVIVTPLDPGTHQETVELKDGVLYFGVANDQKIDISQGFGLSSSTNKWTISEYREYLGLRTLPGDEIKGYTMIDQTLRIMTNLSGDVVGDELIRDYAGENGEKFTLTLSESQKTDSVDVSSSMIAGVSVSVKYDEQQGKYYGQYASGDLSCAIETGNMTQEDFVLLLYNLIQPA